MKKKRNRVLKSKQIVWLLVIILICVVGVFGYNYFQRNQVKEEVEKSIEILESGNMEKINELIFSRTSGIESDGQGILVQVFEGIDISIVGIDRDNIELAINTKDLSEIFQDAEESGETYTEDSLLSYLIKYAGECKRYGAQRFRYCDTLGYDDPKTAYDRIYTIAKETGMDMEMHFHNDLGMAVACSVMGAKAAIDAGVNAWINTAINGMGERAGNADLVSCILAILKSSGFEGKYKIDPQIDISKAWKLAKYTAYAFGVPIPLNQVAVGDNAFAHESGIHADGALKDRRNYELYDYEELGKGEPEIIETGRMITVGEYSGIKGFRNVYQNLELEFKDEEEARNILELVRYANVHTQKPLTKSELRFIYFYPNIAAKIMTVEPYYKPTGALKERIERLEKIKSHLIV